MKTCHSQEFDFKLTTVKMKHMSSGYSGGRTLGRIGSFIPDSFSQQGKILNPKVQLLRGNQSTL